MACRSCGSKNNVEPRSFNDGSNTMQDLFNSGNYIPVKFVGHNYTATIGSPTGVIVADGLKSYGRAANGDYILVHKTDVQAAPQKFVLLEKNSEGYNATLLKYGIVEQVVRAVKPLKSEKPKLEEVKVVDSVFIPSNVPNDEAEVLDVKEVEKPATKEELEDAGGEVLSREQAIPMADFRDKYGYSHHMQVQAKIKSGELKSYRDEEEGITYVYHYDN